MRLAGAGLLASAALGAPAIGAAQATLSVTGTLVISGGGTNTNVIRYSGATVSSGASPVTIQLSPAYPTLVIRGPLPFAASCSVPGDCWDSEVCAGATTTSPGACGFTGIVTPGCTKPPTLDATMDVCAGLIAQERRDGSLFSDLFTRTDQCLSAGPSVAAVGSACPVKQYQDAYDLASATVLDGSQKQIQVTGGGALVAADLQGHLKRIGDWYGYYRQLYPPSGGDPANQKVWAQTSEVLGNFWKNVYAKVGVPQPGTATPSDALLDGMFQQGLEADRTVLQAAFSSPPPLVTAPLVELVGDALQSMSARLVQVGLYHDLSCRFRSCANGSVKTEVSELTHFLAAAATPAELAAALSAAPPTAITSHWAAWRSVFASLSAQSAVFQSAVLDALPGVTTYSPDLLVPPVPALGAPAPAATRATPPLMGLARIVQDARVRTNSFQLTGLFDSRYQGILRAGIQQDRVNEVINRAQSRTADLRTQLTNYKTTRQQLATSVIQQMTNLASQQNVSDQITQRAAREMQMREDIAGLRNAIEVQEARYGDFMQAYGALAEITASSPGTAVNHLLANVTVRPADATWQTHTVPIDPADPLAGFVARPAGLAWPLVALKGDELILSTSGIWSPACALRTSQFLNPLTGQPDRFVVPNPALTGPEGYLATLNGSSFTATSNQSVHSTDTYTIDSNSQKFCAGVGASAGFTSPYGGASAHASADFCKEHDHGKKTSDSTSNGVSSGTESRMAASFATGLRVPNTPFPTFPAGSLLLVQVARGGTLRSDIRDVQVVQKPSTSVVVSDDADVYLVVNDVVDPACGAPDGNALTVALNQMRPFGTVAAQLGQGMATALGHLRQQQALLLEQGRVGPQQMAALRDLAFNDLVAACGTGCSGVSYYPADVLKFFEAWVSKELATLERKVDARTLEREVVLVELEHAALADDLQNLGDQARLLRLMPTWLLKDLDTQLLQSNTQSLLDLLVADLYPIVDLRAPGTLQTLDQSLLAALVGPTLTSTGDWTVSLVDWTTAAVNASDNIVARLRDALGNSPPLNDRIIVLGIPNPAGSSFSPPGNWQRVPPERAQVVWNAIAAKQPFVSLGIEPSDLYPTVAGATDIMFCSDSTPVITGLAIYMVRPGQFETYPGLRVPVSVDRNLAFPDVGVLKSYRIDNGDWLNQAVAVLAGESNQVEAAVAALTADAATPLYRVMNGLSPFTHFDIALPGITTAPSGPAPADLASEMVLAFRLQTRNVANLGLAPMCR
jgi:hypothetical protein